MKRQAANAVWLGNSIRDARERRRLKVTEAHVHPSYLFRIEKGEKVPSRATLLRIAHAVGADKPLLSAWLREAGYEGEAGTDGERVVDPPPGDAPSASALADQSVLAIMSGVTWLRPDEAKLLEQRISGVVSQIVDEWDLPASARAGLERLIADHGPQHSAQMVDILLRDFKPELKLLEPTQLWLLMGAVWLHDVGLARIARVDSDALPGLLNYERESVAYVRQHQTRLGLSEDEGRVLENLCRHHRNTDRLRDVTIGEIGGGMSADQQKAVLVLLRLASMMDVRQNRVVREGRAANLLPFKNLLPADLEGEVIRNLFLLRAYRERHTLCAEVSYSRDFDSEMVMKLKQRLQEELQGGVDLVNDVLILQARSVLLWTKLEIGPPPTPAVHDHLTHALKVLISSHSPNAALVIDSLIGLLEKHVGAGGADAGFTEREVISELEQFGRMKSYQAQIVNLSEDIHAVFAEPALNAAAKLRRVGSVLEQYKKRKEDAYHSIRRVCAALLADGKHQDVILFGYSQSVIEALDAVISLDASASSRMAIHVFECRPKSDHGSYGRHVYCDGEEYARRVHRIGYSDVQVWPDGTAYSTLKCSLAGRRAPVVLLGAEGIDSARGVGDVVSTVGTMPVVLSANYLKIPVYVLTESGKLRPDLGEQGVRQNRWLFSEEKQAELERVTGVKVRNSINERVPADLVTGIVTEHGLLRPGDLARLAQKRSRPA